MKKKMLIDVDHVICDHGFLGVVNKFLGSNYENDDFNEYYVDNLIFKDEETKQAFYEYWVKNDNYDYANLYPGAYEVIKELNEVYDIYICSACAAPFTPFLTKESGIFFKYKYDYLIKKLPFLDPNKFIFTNTKNIFMADIQIDDRLSNLKNNIPLRILFTAYHNHNISEEELKEIGVIRIDNWEEIKRIFL